MMEHFWKRSDIRRRQASVDRRQNSKTLPYAETLEGRAVKMFVIFRSRSRNKNGGSLKASPPT